MKIKFDIEADAREMREFLGLPDLKPLQDEMLRNIRDNMQKGVAGFDPLTLMKPLLPAQMQSMEMLQKAFWDTLNAGAGTQSGEDKSSAKTGKKNA